MTARERAVDKARRRSAEQLATLAKELRDARIKAGRRQADVAKATGISASELSRIELGQPAALQFQTVAMVGAVVGLDVVLKVYPGDHVLSDETQVRLLRALRERLGPGWSWRFEAQVGPGDQRTWDSRGWHADGGITVMVEAETRVRDFQGVLRRIVPKREAAGSPRTILLAADTRTNRAAIAAARDELTAEFPVGTRDALRALASGRDPGADCLIVLPPWRPRSDAGDEGSPADQGGAVTPTAAVPRGAPRSRA